MRIAVPLIALSLVTALACGGNMTPSAPRAEREFSYATVPKIFENLDLPWYGGRIVTSSERELNVSYTRDVASPVQLRRLWPDALEAEGYKEQDRWLSPSGTLFVHYRDPNDAYVRLTVQPLGPHCGVTLSLD